MEYVQNFDSIGDDPVEDQIISIRASAYAAALVPGNQRKGFWHGGELMTARPKLGYKCLGPLRIVRLDVTADCDEIGDGRLGQNDHH